MYGSNNLYLFIVIYTLNLVKNPIAPNNWWLYDNFLMLSIGIYLLNPARACFIFFKVNIYI